jgi:hypothetical protein
MDSLMLLGLPGRQLYCLMPTDQYFVFQHYFIRRRSTRSPRDIRHAEISRYTPEASGGRKHAQVQDLRIPRRAVIGATLKMRRTAFLGLDNCARLKLKLSDGAIHRFAVLGSHTQSELREIFGISGPQSAEPRVYDARPGFTPPAANLPSFVPPTPAPVKQAPLRNREARRERVRAHLEDMALLRNEKLWPLMRALTFPVVLGAYIFSVIDSSMVFGRGAPALLAPAICIACILAILFLPIVLPQWFSLFQKGKLSESIPIGMLVFFPALGLLFRSFYRVASASPLRLARIVYPSLPRFFLIAAIPGAVIALAVWLLAKERKFAPGALTVYCCVLLVLLAGVGGRINTLDVENPPDRTESVQFDDRNFGETTFDDFQKLTVQTSEGELTVLVPDWLRSYLLNNPKVRRNISVDFYDGALGIPFAIARVD